MSPLMVRLLLAPVIVAVAALVLAVVAGGTASSVVVAGIIDPGALTRWGLPVAKLAANLAAAASVGLLLLGAVLMPSKRGALSPDATRYVRAASWAARVWAVTTALTLIFTLSDVFARPPAELFDAEVFGLVTTIPQVVALIVVLLPVTGVALFARRVTTAGGAMALLAAALVTLVPPVLTGHSASSPNHSLAVTGLALHILTLVLWVGGLGAVTVHALRKGPDVAVVVRRFSRVALWSFAGVAVSGAATIAARLSEPGQLFDSPYGMLVLIKTEAFAVLGFFGWLHRRRTIAAVEEGKPGSFLRLAAGELMLMGAVVGLAVALSRTSPPLLLLPADPARDLLGYAMPPAITAVGLATLWRLDLLFALAALCGAGVYAAGVARLRRRGETWPVGRSVAWGLGLALVVVFTQSGIATYAPVLFSMHMVQHLGLAVPAAILLVLGAPVTLALRAFDAAPRKGDRGPREWISAVLDSRAAEVIAHPVVAVVVLVGGSYGLYHTSLFETLMFQPAGHILLGGYFLLSGTLFFWVVAGVDPVPRRLGYGSRLGALVMVLAFHMALGMSLRAAGRPVAAAWYESLPRIWGPGLLEDQQTAGAVVWALGGLPVAVVAVVLAARWWSSNAGRRPQPVRGAERPAN
jgi:putative copper resistance protein D